MRHAATLYWDLVVMPVDLAVLFGLAGHLKMLPFLVGYGRGWRLSDFWRKALCVVQESACYRVEY